MISKWSKTLSSLLWKKEKKWINCFVSQFVLQSNLDIIEANEQTKNSIIMSFLIDFFCIQDMLWTQDIGICYLTWPWGYLDTKFTKTKYTKYASFQKDIRAIWVSTNLFEIIKKRWLHLIIINLKDNQLIIVRNGQKFVVQNGCRNIYTIFCFHRTFLLL